MSFNYNLFLGGNHQTWFTAYPHEAFRYLWISIRWRSTNPPLLNILLIAYARRKAHWQELLYTIGERGHRDHLPISLTSQLGTLGSQRVNVLIKSHSWFVTEFFSFDFCLLQCTSHNPSLRNYFYKPFE